MINNLNNVNKTSKKLKPIKNDNGNKTRILILGIGKLL